MTSSVVSFDVFDTALERTVYEPTDIFKLVEKTVGNNFYTKRIEAEKKAREKKKFYTLKDIYKYLPEFTPDEELKQEFECCRANKDILKVYNETEGKIFISDMYLPSKTIIKMLESVGYENPKVFVSCELKANKGSGELFKKVMEIEKCAITKHYGDNYLSDIEGAKIAGIDKVEFKVALHKKALNIPILNNPKLKKCFALAADNLEAPEKIALSVAPLISEFTKWVLKNRKKGEKILFCSRDMIVPYRLATEVLHKEDVFYIHVSRKSLAPLAYSLNMVNVQNHLSGTYSKKEIENFKNTDTSYALKYLKGFNLKDGDIIVDIGYRGTSQEIINKALGIKLKGAYMSASRCYDGLEVTQFLSRPVIRAGLLVETPLGSPEDCVEGYSSEGVVFIPENEDRKRQAVTMTNFLFDMSSFMLDMNISLFDVEQALIHLQAYPDTDVIDEFNKNIYVNRGINESIIGFNRDRIMNGELRDCYAKSYCKPLFKKLLESDKELKYLSKLI